MIEWGVASEPLRPSDPSGDLHVIAPFSRGVLVAAVDGLGHGPEARAAAERAAEALRDGPEGSPSALLERCHQRLRGTRGAAVSLASIDGERDAMTWIAVGNVGGVLTRGDGRTRANLLLRGGVVGYRLPRLVDRTEQLDRGDTLVFFTDGIEREALRRVGFAAPPQRVADELLGHRLGRDDAMALVVRYRGGAA